MSVCEAQAKYVDLVTELSPDWETEETDHHDSPGNRRGSGLGPVFSRMQYDTSGPSGKGSEGKDSEIHAAARAGNLPRLQAIVKQLGEAGRSTEVDGVDEDGCTPLHLAVDSDAQECAKLLLQAGANINAQDNAGMTPLHYAGTCGHEDLFRFLISSGADNTLVDEDGSAAAL
eukprot:scaffold1456_cov392-Prasinococcus_capsulatus_cf.AAC.5